MQAGDAENRLGARFALDIAPLSEGLHVISYQSTLSTLTYTEWAKFLEVFLTAKAFADIEAIHDARPRERFRSKAVAVSKTLVGVGNSIGSDFQIDIEFARSIIRKADDLKATVCVSNSITRRRKRTMRRLNCSKKAPDGA
jgi:hypothetical protein